MALGSLANILVISLRQEPGFLLRVRNLLNLVLSLGLLFQVRQGHQSLLSSQLLRQAAFLLELVPVPRWAVSHLLLLQMILPLQQHQSAG